MKIDIIRENKIVFACFLIAAIFLFKNLGNIYFWSDEAYSAVCAKNTLTFGYPKSFDGRNIAQHYWYVDGEWKFTPYNRTTPWLHLYMAAASFALFGVNTLAARLPFAFTGLITLICLFLFMREYEEDKFLINTAVIMLTFSIPFFLHMRQCRYYGPATLFTLLTAWGYMRLHHTGEKKFFIISSIFLFLSLQSAFIIMVMGVGIHCLLRFDRKRFKELLVSAAWVSTVAIPITIQLKLWETPDDLTGLDKGFLPRRNFSNFISYLVHINDFVFPFLLIAIFIIWGIKKGIFTRESFKRREHITFFIILSCINVVFLALAAPHHFRLISHNLVIFCILGAYIVYFYKQQLGTITGSILLALILSTNIFNIASYYIMHIPVVPELILKKPLNKLSGWNHMYEWLLDYKMKNHMRLRSYPAEFIYEITHDYDGPIEGISKYINENAGPDDLIKMSYGDYAVQFYTNRLVIPRGEFEDETRPDWWIFRGRRWNQRYNKPPLKEVFAEVLEREYEAIEIDYPELPWENQPEPEYHKYRTVTDAPKVIIYRRKKPSRLSREEKKAIITNLWATKSYK